MSDAVFDEFFRFLSAEPEDEDMARKQKIGLRALLDVTPEYRDEIETRAKLTTSRDHLRRVLARRKLALSADDEARIDSCTDLATLDGWLDQAVDAPSVEEALK